MLAWIGISIFICVTTASIIVPYRDETKCEKDFFFQSSSLRCLECGEKLNKTSNSLSCECQNGFRLKENNGGPIIECVACNNLQVTSKDGWSCIKCKTDGEYDAVSKTCPPCPSGSVKVERQEDGSFFPDNRQRCLKCFGDTKASSQKRVCQRCDTSILKVTGSSSCTCPVGSTTVNGAVVSTIEEDGTCLSSDKVPFISEQTSAYLLRYPNGQTFESVFFKKHLRSAQALCRTYQNYTACQLLGNLCVLNMYNEVNYKNSRISTTDACKEFLLILSSYRGEFVQRLTDWPVTMPWLYYKADTPIEVLGRTDIATSFKRKQIVKFVFVKYSVRGKFLGVTKSSVLQLCVNNDMIASKAFEFTTSYKIQCQIKLTELVRTFETVFYDMYLLINDEELYPVPVLVDNIDANKNADKSRWVLTRRFFLVDSVSGRTKDGSMAVVQYASNVVLSYTLKGDGKIYPPLLKIKYSAVELGKQDKLLNVYFEVNYEMNVNNILRGVEISVGVLSVIGIIYSVIQIISWRRRENLQMVDCSSLFTFLLFLCNSLSFVFIVIIIGTCIQWLFFFKQQTTVIRVLPTSSQETLIKALLIVGFSMKVIDVIYVLYLQVSFDVFFIDWERPRGTVNVATNKNNSLLSSPVSIMRTLFVANEWRELQTMRRIKPILQIMVLLFFLKVAGLEYWSTTDPISRTSIDRSIDYVGDINLTLRLGVISIIFLLAALFQWLIFGFLYERFMSDPLGDFVDFCSISNISLFVITNSYYGYYIHGRSVHGRSDCSLHELYEQFQREEESLCGRRGLEPNTDRQTFEIALTVKFKNEYSKIKQPLLARDNQARRGQLPSRQNAGLPGALLNTTLEKSVMAYSQMNRYLSSFMEHAVLDNDYVVKDKFFMEKLLKNELQPPLDKCYFYNDDSRAFSEVLLYGQEWSLAIFNLFLFLVFDWATNYNLFFAAVITYFTDVALVAMRDTLGKKNLAKKTMVDERFLI